MTTAINWKKNQPAPLTMWSWIHTYFPQARNLGIYVNRNIAGTNKPSPHAEGRALDIGLKVNVEDEKIIGDSLFRLFIYTNEELELDHVIWNRKMWAKGARSIVDYNGKNPHTDHVHVAWTRSGSQKTEFPITLQNIQTTLKGIQNKACYILNLP